MKLISRMIVAAVALMVFAGSARAQGLGVRAGASVDPDQFYGGVHFETRELVEHLRFRPNLEVGVGDDVTLFAVNFEFSYRLPPAALPRSMSMWHLYVGGGPALNIFHFRTTRDRKAASTGWPGSLIATACSWKPSSARSTVPTSSSASATRFIRETTKADATITAAPAAPATTINAEHAEHAESERRAQFDGRPAAAGRLRGRPRIGTRAAHRSQAVRVPIRGRPRAPQRRRRTSPTPS